MTKEVLISIRGTQGGEGDEPQTIELTTDGTLYREGDAICISYVESELSGMEGVITTFRVEPNRIILTREGQVSSIMTFVVGEWHESLYDVGCGAMLLGVCARKVSSTLEESGGALFVDYDVELEHIPVGNNLYEVEVREVHEKPQV